VNDILSALGGALGDDENEAAAAYVETNQVSSTLQTLNLQLIKWIPLEGRSTRTSQSNKS
jgi:hypothetical protein